MTETVTETFYLPDEIGRDMSRIPADIYNTSHNLLARSEYNCVFVPIRTLQVFGVVTENEIVFVDSLSYAHVDNEGGRIILLTWRFIHTHDREAIDEPVDCEIVFHHENGRAVQSRLIMELRSALEHLDKKYREEALPAEGARIVKLNKDQD